MELQKHSNLDSPLAWAFIDEGPPPAALEDNVFSPYRKLPRLLLPRRNHPSFDTLIVRSIIGETALFSFLTKAKSGCHVICTRVNKFLCL